VFARQVTLLGLFGVLFSPVAAAQVTMDPSSGNLGPDIMNSGPHYLGITVTNDNPNFVWPAAETYSFSCTGSGVTINNVQPNGFSLSYQDQVGVNVTYTAGGGNGSIHCSVQATNPPTGDAASGDYSVTVVGVSVTPDGGQVVVGANTTDTVGFTVKNTGPGTNTFVLTCTKTGGPTCLSVFSPGHAPRSADTVQLGGGATTAASIIYSVGTTDGTVTLHAIDLGQVASDTGWYGVQVSGPDPTVSLTPYSGRFNVAGEGVTYVHATPSVGSMGRTWGMALEYNSATARPVSVVSIDVTGPTSPAPSMYKFQVQLASNGVFLTLMNGTTAVYYSPAPGIVDRLTAAVDAQTNGLATGSYPVNLVLTTTYPLGPRTTTKSTRLLVNDQTSSPFGAGVGLVGMGRLYTVTDGYGRLLVNGSGSTEYFERLCPTCPFLSPAGESRRLTSSNDTLFSLTAVDGSITQFNTQGYQVRHYLLDGIQDFTFSWTNNLLTAVTDASGRGFTLTYSAGLLTQITDFAGRITKDSIVSGRLVKVTAPDGGKDSLSYNAANLLLQLNSRTGGVWNYGYNALYQSDTVRAPTATDHTGASVRPTTTVVTQAEILWQPGIAGTSSGAPKGSVRPDTVYARTTDPLGRMSRVQLDRFGLPTKIVDALGQTTQLNRDTVGNVVHARAPTGHATTTSFGGAGSLYLVTQTYDSSTAERLSYTYDGPTRRLICIQGGRVRLDFFYHDGSQGPAGMLREIYAGRYEFCGSGLGPTGGAGVAWHYPNAYGQDTLVVDGGGHKSRWVYATPASGGSLTQTIDAIGNVTSFHYNAYGLVDTTTLPNGIRQSTTYDLINRPTATTNGLGYRTQYSYGPTGLSRVTDPKLRPYKFGVNAWGFVVAQHDFGDTTKVDSLKYNAAGEVRTAITRRGDTITVTYDALGRLRTRTGTGPNPFPAESLNYGLLPAGGSWTVASSTNGRDSLAYDKAGRLVYTGQRFPGDPTTYAMSYTYDANGRLINRTAPQYGSSARWVYNSNLGLLDTMCLVGTCTAIARDEELKPDTLKFHAGAANPWRQMLFYDSLHRVKNDGFSAAAPQTSLTSAWIYDSLDRVIVQSKSPGTYPRELYSYDAAGHLINACHKLTSSSPCNNEYSQAGLGAYAYDSAGNRVDTTAHAVLASGNRMSQFKGYAITYDAAGNVIQKAGLGTVGIWTSTDTTTFQWNGRGQLIRVEKWPAGGTHVVVTFRYDARGRRISMTVPGWFNPVTTWFIYDRNNVAMDLDSASQAVRAEYGFTAGGALHAIRTMTDTGMVITTPKIGTVLGIARANGGGVLEAFPDRVANSPLFPWGEAADTGLFLMRYRMGQQEHDVYTGLYHMSARYYDPQLGRWLSEDPAGIAGGINLYAYAGNDPVNGRDPTGLWDCVDAGDPGVGPWVCHYTSQDCADIGLALGDQCWNELASGFCSARGEGFDAATSSCISWLLGDEPDIDGPQEGGSPQAVACPAVPVAPPDANLRNNIVETQMRRGMMTPPNANIWWVNQVKPGGAWDYKLQTPDHILYDPYGNFTFGATGAALGFSLDQLLRGGGFVAQTTEHNLLSAILKQLFGGELHGEAPWDAEVIKAGYTYFQNACYAK
jgi:RHS repeat-associated protein